MQSKDPKGHHSKRLLPLRSWVRFSLQTVGLLLYIFARFKVMAGGINDGVQYLKSVPGVLKILEIVSIV
jgi:hypothetical protein